LIKFYLIKSRKASKHNKSYWNRKFVNYCFFLCHLQINWCPTNWPEELFLIEKTSVCQQIPQKRHCISIS